MALTAGPAHLPALEALAEALELQAALPERARRGRAGPARVSRPATSALTLPLARGSRREGSGGGDSAALALATLVAIGIGLHNLGEGLAIGTSFAFGELALGTFLIVGFMVHNVTEGLGIAAPIAEARSASALARLAALALIAGAPAISAPGSAAS